MRQGDEVEPSRPRDLAGLELVGGVQIGVQEGDGRRGEPLGDGRLQPHGQGRAVERAQHGAGGVQSLIRLHNAGIEWLGLDDVEGEEAGPGLIADDQGVGESLGGDE
jgi:hypothetical protein